MKNEKGKIKKARKSYLGVIFTFFSLLFSFFFCIDLPAQVASRTDGDNVFYYDSFFEAVAVATGSVDQPDEITLLADVVFDEPFIVDDGVHIRLVAGGSDRTIRRSVNLIKYPVIWVKGEGANLSLGKPGMEVVLIIDGGFLNSPSIEAHAPLVAVNGQGSKLIMYDNVVMQNNYNCGSPSLDSYYENGGCVVIWTQDPFATRHTEFIMKGGTIRGNMSNAQFPCGGGIFIHQFGVFTMEGGAIMNNTAGQSGGGVYIFSNGSFKKTGGVIYGANAPAGYRNTALVGLGTVKSYGHSVAVANVIQLFTLYRDDTVKENDNLALPRVHGNILIGKWDTPGKALLRMLIAIILPVLVFVTGVFLILWRRYYKRLAGIVQAAADTTPYIDLENMGLTDREKDLCELLLTDRNLKEIADILGLTYAGGHKKVRKLYVKLGIEDRTELLVRVKRTVNNANEQS